MLASDCQQWRTQAVAKSLTWTERTWIAEYCRQLVPSNKPALDARLASAPTRLKDDRTTTVAQLEFAEQTLVVKRYNPRNQWHKVKRALRRSRARRCWQMSYAFAEAGLNVAAPVLMFEHRFGPLRLDAYFVNKFLAGQELLTLFPDMDTIEQALVVEEVRTAFAKMRTAKLSHGDMKASNLIWSNQKLFFIDLDAAQQHRSSLTWTKAHQKDRKRFLKNWAGNQDLRRLFDAL